MKKTVLPLFLGLLLVFASVKPVAADAMFLFRVVDTVHGNVELAQTDTYSITLVGKVDGLTYHASSWFAGYNNPGTFLPQTQGYDITVECTIRGNQFRKTVSADASLFTSARRFIINLTETEWLNPPVYFDAFFQVKDPAGDPIPYATVIVSPDNGATTLRGYADENGCATVRLPEITHDYFVGANGVYGAIDPSLATLRATTAAAPYIITVSALPTHAEITGLTQTVQTFVDGVLFRTLTTTPLYHDASAAEVYSGVRFDGRAVCTGVTCTVNGADYPCTYMPDSSVETGTVRFLTAGLANGDTIVLTFQYAYTDADTDYEVSAFHEFYADTSLSTDALLEIRPDTVLLRKPGETFSVSALTTDAAPLFDAGIAGFEHGAFRMAMFSVFGGDDGTLKGTLPTPDLAPSTYVYENAMIHDNVTLRFLYYYVPDMVLSFANLDGSGAAATDGDFAPIYSRDGSVTLPAAAPERTGFIFVGWQAAPASPDAAPDPDAELLAPGAALTVTADTVLTAVWEEDLPSTGVNDGLLLYAGLAALALAGCAAVGCAAPAKVGCAAPGCGKKRKA